ncbi:MAG: N-acetyl sugar amidotransferase [Pseudomonadota bacterium]|nr:N-acetyl sugar amidotransferase [Pseudomonadota bacterium]
MDTSADDIVFDDRGMCNYCTDFVAQRDRFVEPDPVIREQRMDALVAKVKAEGKDKKYDCIVGVSGGVDSSWTLVNVVERGLRPLAVHMDSGWNAELAQNNIANVVRGLGVDLYTHVINWSEIRGLMEAFFASDVIDVEVLYDNAMIAVNYQQAARHGLQYILAGTNIATEGMRMPRNWNWLKHDKRNIKGISAQFGGPGLKTFPSIGTLQYIKFIMLNRIKWVSFLDYTDYKKSDALAELTKKYKYKPYAYKHYESIFTRFYQGYILPEKFGVDKRRLHLSNLVMTGEMTREEALASVGGIAYPNQMELDADKLYFIKKMGWTEQKLKDYIARPEKSHTDYPSEAAFHYWALDMYRKFKLSAGKVL